MPLRAVRAAASSLGSTAPFLSLASVLIALDITDGSDKPYEFSARVRKTYVVAGFKSNICKCKKEKRNKIMRRKKNLVKYAHIGLSTPGE